MCLPHLILTSPLGRALVYIHNHHGEDEEVLSHHPKGHREEQRFKPRKSDSRVCALNSTPCHKDASCQHSH